MGPFEPALSVHQDLGQIKVSCPKAWTRPETRSEGLDTVQEATRPVLRVQPPIAVYSSTSLISVARGRRAFHTIVLNPGDRCVESHDGVLSPQQHRSALHDRGQSRGSFHTTSPRLDM